MCCQSSSPSVVYTSAAPRDFRRRREKPRARSFRMGWMSPPPDPPHHDSPQARCRLHEFSPSPRRRSPEKRYGTELDPHTTDALEHYPHVTTRGSISASLVAWASPRIAQPPARARRRCAGQACPTAARLIARRPHSKAEPRAEGANGVASGVGYPKKTRTLHFTQHVQGGYLHARRIGKQFRAGSSVGAYLESLLEAIAHLRLGGEDLHGATESLGGLQRGKEPQGRGQSASPSHAVPAGIHTIVTSHLLFVLPAVQPTNRWVDGFTRSEANAP